MEALIGSRCKHSLTRILIMKAGQLFLEKRSPFSLRTLPTFADALSKKNRTRASFKKPLANYISLESLINAVFGKNIILAKFPFTKRREPVQTETTETCLIELIGYRTLRQEWITASVIHKASINKTVSGIFDIPIGYLDIHLQSLSSQKYPRCVA